MEYEVTVRAFNAMGYSPYSMEVVDRTWEAGKLTLVIFCDLLVIISQYTVVLHD
jgi:hypothetical protein